MAKPARVPPMEDPRRLREDDLEAGREEAPEEAPVLALPPPMVEIFIHNANLQVDSLPQPDGQVIKLLRLLTPSLVFTIRLDEEGAETLAEAVLGRRVTNIAIARPGQIHGLRG